MATMLKETDAVVIGVGFTGSILARELTKAGLKVVGLERGANRSAREDFVLPSVRDDLKHAVRQERFQKLRGISGKAGNLRGQKIDGGNVFEGPRQNEYPNKPLVQTMAGSLMQQASKELGYHPFPAPSANMSAVYTNPEGVTLGACQ